MKLSTIRTAAVCLVLALSAVLTMSVRAGDQLHLTDGQVLEGTVTNELNGYIWFKYSIAGVEQETMFEPSQYDKLVRGIDPTLKADGDMKPGADERRHAARRSGAPRAAVITLGDGKNNMVGMYITAAKLRDLIPLLEAEEITIVVFRVMSGGGYLLEIERISDVIHEEYKPKFRTVAWIESAISAAAMSAHCIEEIYLMPQGSYGACTGWSGALQAVKGRDLEEVLYLMERISARGGYDTKIMRSMQIMEPLSATIDENGDVEFFQDLSGEIKLNPEGRILTFTSDVAEEIKFSRGTADSIEELTAEMGLEEVDWVGVTISGVPYPVSRAEDHMRKWRLKTAEDERRFNEYYGQYQQTKALAAGAQDKADRGRFAGMAIKNLKRLGRVVRSNPNFGLFLLGFRDEDELKYWLQDQEEEIRDMMRD